MKRIVAGFLVLISIAGCSEIRKATSEAYQLGWDEGNNYRQLQSDMSAIDSWIEDAEYSLDDFNSETVGELCKLQWQIVGPTNMLENTESNAQDFIDGCLDGYNG